MAEIVNGVSIAHADDPEDFVEKTVAFPDGSVFERLEPITDLRKDPGEGRVLYLCKRIKDADLPEGIPSTAAEASEHDVFVLKIKAQWPGPQGVIHPGPSPETAAELKALRKFRERKIDNVPHLITWKKATQPQGGIHPGGYIIYIVMSHLPGGTLWAIGYWGMPPEQREEIQRLFISKLRQIRAMGIKLYDCALRNIMWDGEQKRMSIVDFEHYDESDEPIPAESEKEEFQRWGLVSRPPPRTWFQEWGLKGY